MFTRILTEVERKHVRAYLKQDGEKKVEIRKLVSGARKHLLTIRLDLELLERLLATYAKR
jgi:hypothetical protein